MSQQSALSRRSFSTIAVLLVVVPFLGGVLWWSYFAHQVAAATAAVGQGPQRLFPFQESGFRSEFWQGLGMILHPMEAINIAGVSLVFLLAAVAVTAGFWYAYARFGEARLPGIVGLPAILPFLVGLGYMPTDLFRLFAALARAGLSNPELIARGVGETAVIPAMGLIFSIVLLLFFIRWYAHRRAKLRVPETTVA